MTASRPAPYLSAVNRRSFTGLRIMVTSDEESAVWPQLREQLSIELPAVDVSIEALSSGLTIGTVTDQVEIITVQSR